MLKGKKILLGVTGSIAAYKAAFLVRLFIKEQAEVKIILTKSACSFITPLTLSTLSKNKVSVDFEENGEWVNHVDLGLWADVFVIAPATANTIAKMATGQSDNLLMATYLSARCPVVVSPAMDLDMFLHPSTQRNLKQIQADGNKVLDVVDGELASGLHGKGRMEEPEEILKQIVTLLN